MFTICPRPEMTKNLSFPSARKHFPQFYQLSVYHLTALRWDSQEKLSQRMENVLTCAKSCLSVTTVGCPWESRRILVRFVVCASCIARGLFEESCFHSITREKKPCQNDMSTFSLQTNLVSRLSQFSISVQFSLFTVSDSVHNKQIGRIFSKRTTSTRPGHPEYGDFTTCIQNKEM